MVFSCQNNGKYTVYKCTSDLQIDQFSDSSFFSDIRCMQYSQGKIYVLDVQRRDIVVFDENFGNMNFIGKPGRGPQELAEPYQFYTIQDTMYIMDSGVGSIKSIYQDSVFYQQSLNGRHVCNRFFYSSGNFYLSLPTDSSLFVVLEKTTDKNAIEKCGGKVFRFDIEKATIIHNYRNLLYNGTDVFYATSQNFSNIEEYDLKTLQLINILDISDIPIVRHNLNYSDTHPLTNPNSLYTPFVDSYLSDNSLYLLCLQLGDNFKTNQLIRISLFPQIKVSAIYELPGKIYRSFCVSPDYIYAFNFTDATIERFKLSDYE
jgi:hypothetical protein